MTDNSTQSQPLQNSGQVVQPASDTSSATIASATDRLEALLKDLQSSDAAATPAQAVVQPTVEQQLQGNSQSDFNSYDKMIQKISRKYSQGKPSLTELLRVFESGSDAELETVQPNRVVAAEPAAPVEKLTSQPTNQSDSAPVGHDWSKWEPIEQPAEEQPIKLNTEAAASAPVEPVSKVAEVAKPESGDLKMFMNRLSGNLKKFGRLKIVDFNVVT